MTDLEFKGFLVVLPDLSRLWIHDCPELNGYAVDSTLRAIQQEIEFHPDRMTERLEGFVRDLEEHLPDDKYWRERTVD